jgi:hypothetical protein
VEPEFRRSGGVGGEQDNLALAKVGHPDPAGEFRRQDRGAESRECVDLERFLDDRSQFRLSGEVAIEAR